MIPKSKSSTPIRDGYRFSDKIMLKRDGLRLSFIAAFFALTLLPLAQMAFHLPSAQPVDENRTLAAPPRPIWQDPFEWAKEADAWFTDHFGFRSLLIRVNAQIDYSLFRTSSRVYIGKDGQLFYRWALDTEKPKVERYLRAHAGEILENIRRLHSAFASRGIRFALSVNLLAEHYFPEKLPASAPHDTGPQQIDSLIAQLDQLLGPDYFDVSPILRATAQKHPIFHKTDFHWNSPSAGEVARVVVNRWASLLGYARPVWAHEIEMRPVRFSGGIARFMPLFFPPEETTLDIHFNYQGPPGVETTLQQGIFEATHRVANRPDLLPTLVMAGDSFSDGYLVAGFWIYFQNMYRVRWGPGMTISRMVESSPDDTRLFFLQFLETNFFALSALADTADITRAVEMIEKRPAAGANVAPPPIR